MKRHRLDGTHGNGGDETTNPGTPGKRTRTEMLRPVQLKSHRAAEVTEEAATRGIQGAAQELPFAPAIQRSFGHHDVSGIRAHVGGEAARANEAMGSTAYAMGNDVSFGGAPDLHTAAHEAAHVVQQRAGVHLKGGVGESGDAYERHADAVADRVVAGGSAEALLDEMSGGGGGAPGVQHKEEAAGATELRAAAAAQAEAIRTELDEAQLELKAVAAVRDHIDGEIAEAQKKYDAAKKGVSDPYGEYDLPEYDKLEALKDRKAKNDAKETELNDTITQAHDDLKLIEKPGASAADLNKMLTRRGAPVAGRHTETKVDDPESRKAAGEGRLENLTDRNRTTTDETSWAVGDMAVTDTKTKKRTLDRSGVGWGEEEELAVEGGDASSSKKKSKDHKIGLDGYTGTTEETTSHTDGDYSTSESKKGSVSVSAGGITKTEEKSVKVGDHEIKEESSFGVTRGDGKIGVGGSKTKTDGEVDEDGNLVKGTKTHKEGEAHVILDKDQVGAGGSASASRETAHSKNVSTKVSTACDGHVTVSIKPYEGDNEALEGRFVVVVSVAMNASVSGEGTLGKKSGWHVGGGVTASGGVSMSFRHVLSKEECDDYLAQLGAVHPGDAGNGKYPELAQIATAWKNGWTNDGAAAAAGATQAALLDSPDAAREMAEGDAFEYSVTGNVDAKGSAGGNVGIVSFEAEGGVTKGGTIKVSLAKVDGKMLITVYIEGSEGWNAGGGAGVVGVNVKAKHARTTTGGKGATFALDPNDPQYSAIKADIESARSAADIDALIARYARLQKGSEKLDSETKSTTVGVDYEGYGVEMGGSGTVSKHVTTDEEGKETVVDSGESTASGKLKLGDFEIGGSSTEAISTEVDSEGNATGDLSTTESGTSMKKTLLEWDDRRNQSGAVGVATGSTTTPKPVDETEQTGMLLSNSDYDTIIARANDKAYWGKQWTSHRHKDAWLALGREIRAAGGDKKKVSEALAKFMGDGGHGHEELLSGVVREAFTDKGGAMYEFPDGLGDLKSTYAKLVFNDPSAKAEELWNADKKEEAAKEAQSKLDALDSLWAQLSTHQAEFKDKSAFGEMLHRIGERKQKLNKYLGKGEGEVAKDRYNDLLDNCGRFKDEETRVFSQIVELMDGGMNASNTIDKVNLENQLRALYLKWDPSYEEMVGLAETWGFDMKICKQYKPDKKRWKKAYEGEVPVEETWEEKMDAEYAEREEADFSRKIYERSHAYLEAKAAAEAKQAENEKIKAAKAQRALVAAAKNRAAMAAGWHNYANANKKPIADAAQKKAGDGWTKFALAGQEEATFRMVCDHAMGTVNGVNVAAGKTIKLYDEAEALFKEGKALNG